MRTAELTKELRKVDSDLSVKEMARGRLAILRKRYVWDSFSVADCTLRCLRNYGDPILWLTDDWTMNGNSVEWGWLPILARIRAIDLDTNPTMFSDMMKSYRDGDKSKERAMENSIESFMHDYRSEFKEKHKDINTSSLSKIDNRRKKDGSLKS